MHLRRQQQPVSGGLLLLTFSPHLPSLSIWPTEPCARPAACYCLAQYTSILLSFAFSYQHPDAGDALGLGTPSLQKVAP
jgi:hypothetical protein